jgi:hypothetical protein
MSEIDELVRRAVGTVTLIAAKAAAFSGRVLLMSIVVCGGSFLLGVRALSNGVESVWIVLGLCFGAIAIGGAAIAFWRANSVRRHLPELADEIRVLVTDGRPEARTVIETFEVGDPDAASGSAIMLSRQMGGFRGALGPVVGQTKRLAAATSALVAFPFQMLVTILVSSVFGFLALIFLLALAL